LDYYYSSPQSNGTLSKIHFVMKTIASKIFALALVLVASFQLAQAKDIDPKTPSVVAAEKFAYSLYAINETSKFRLAFVNEQGSNVNVKVYDQAGKLIFTDKIKGQTELKRNYDLGEMGRGVYTVEISNGEFKTSDRVAVGGATLNPVAFNAYISPSLIDGAFKVAYEGGGEGVYITVKDANGTLLYSERNESENFARKYNISTLRPGSYTVNVESNDKSVEQAFVVK
jgi:flagellar hook assembly protein FlgD